MPWQRCLLNVSWSPQKALEVGCKATTVFKCPQHRPQHQQPQFARLITNLALANRHKLPTIQFSSSSSHSGKAACLQRCSSSAPTGINRRARQPTDSFVCSTIGFICVLHQRRQRNSSKASWNAILSGASNMVQQKDLRQGSLQGARSKWLHFGYDIYL